MIDHSADPAVDLELDGNAVAGTLEAAFGVEMTAVEGRCAHCGTEHVVGAMRAYTRGPGIVLRCPSCDGVVLRVVVAAESTVLDLRGAAVLRVPRPEPTG